MVMNYCFSLLMVVLTLMLLKARHTSYEKWKWDFYDFPDMCKRKIKKTEEALGSANTPHFGGTPNNSQVWM